MDIDRNLQWLSDAKCAIGYHSGRITLGCKVHSTKVRQFIEVVTMLNYASVNHIRFTF